MFESWPHRDLWPQDVKKCEHAVAKGDHAPEEAGNVMLVRHHHERQAFVLELSFIMNKNSDPFMELDTRRSPTLGLTAPTRDGPRITASLRESVSCDCGGL